MGDSVAPLNTQSGDRWRFTIQGPLHDGEAIIGFAAPQGKLFLVLFGQV